MATETKPVRTFDFPPSTQLWQAMPVVVAALADEGLRLTDSDNATLSRVTTVLIDGVKRVVVPTHRIARAYAEPRPASCACGLRTYPSEAEATKAEPNGAFKCPNCHTFARDHAFRGDDNTDWRCYDCDVRLHSHGGPQR